MKSQKISKFKFLFLKNLRNLPKKQAFRFACLIILLGPVLSCAGLMSWRKMRRWRNPGRMRELIQSQPLVFPDLKPETLEVKSVSGGISNANQTVRCKNKQGEEITLFAKIFAPLGTIWARHLSDALPFPRVLLSKTHERFSVEMACRLRLYDAGAPVAHLITYSIREQVLVLEYLKGTSLDGMFASAAEPLSTQITAILASSGKGLAQIHKAGFCLVDAQPSNCLWVPAQKRVYFTDLEYATRRDLRAWDLAYFLAFVAIRIPDAAFHAAREIMLNAYTAEDAELPSGLSAEEEKLKPYRQAFQMVLDLRQFTPEQMLEEIVS